jgi:hypothetical protein
MRTGSSLNIVFHALATKNYTKNWYSYACYKSIQKTKNSMLATKNIHEAAKRRRHHGMSTTGGGSESSSTRGTSSLGSSNRMAIQLATMMDFFLCKPLTCNWIYSICMERLLKTPWFLVRALPIKGLHVPIQINHFVILGVPCLGGPNIRNPSYHFYIDLAIWSALPCSPHIFFQSLHCFPSGWMIVSMIRFLISNNELTRP